MNKIYTVLLLSIVLVSCSSKKQSDQVGASDASVQVSPPSSNSTTTSESSGSSGSSGYIIEDDIARQAIQEAINEYNKARRGSDNSMMYANAAVVAELYRQIGDAANYRVWKNIEDGHTRQMELDIQRQIDLEVNSIDDYKE